MEKELQHLIGQKIIEVQGNTVTFEDGTQIDFHPYETYVYNPND